MFGMLAEQEEIAEYVLNDKRLDELPRTSMPRAITPTS